VFENQPLTGKANLQVSLNFTDLAFWLYLPSIEMLGYFNKVG